MHQADYERTFNSRQALPCISVTPPREFFKLKPTTLQTHLLLPFKFKRIFSMRVGTRGFEYQSMGISPLPGKVSEAVRDG